MVNKTDRELDASGYAKPYRAMMPVGRRCDSLSLGCYALEVDSRSEAGGKLNMERTDEFGQSY